MYKQRGSHGLWVNYSTHYTHTHTKVEIDDVCLAAIHADGF